MRWLRRKVLERRQHEAAVATEHAAQAAQRERDAGASLEATRARERDARERRESRVAL